MRGVEARARLLERAGGALRQGEVAALLDVTPQAVAGRRSRGTILAVPLANGEAVFPACQFAESGLVDGLPDFLKALDEDPWTQLSVLLAPSRRFQGRTALELLQSGHLDAALSIAGSYGTQG